MRELDELFEILKIDTNFFKISMKNSDNKEGSFEKQDSYGFDTLEKKVNSEFNTEDEIETKTIIKESARVIKKLTQESSIMENMFGLNNKLTNTEKINEVRKSGPGRPPRQHSLKITKSIKKEDISLYTKEEIQSLKYRRARDLNNEASKKCRAVRRGRQIKLEECLHLEEKRNRNLTSEYNEQVKKLDSFKIYMYKRRLIMPKGN